MSGPLEELDEVPTGLRERIEFERAKVASTAEEFGEASSIGNRLRARLRALDWVLDLLAASGTGERPACTCLDWRRDQPCPVHGKPRPTTSDEAAFDVGLGPLIDRAAPAPPDAGTGTPSDEGRRFGLDDVGDATSSATILPTDWDEDEQGEPPWCAVTYRFAAEDPESTSRVGLAPEHWVWELVTGGTALLDGTASYDNPAPTLQRIVDLLAAAPSGTTGATTGHDDGSPWAKCPDRERCIGFVRCLTDRDCPAEPFAAPPSTGAESRDDR